MTPDLTDRVELVSGRFLNLRDPDPADIVLEDIAHGLSMTCRFSGQCRVFYSVAEHAINVSNRLGATGHDHWTRLAGLHHDDAEAFVTDVPRPAKALLPDYAVLERVVQEACLKAIALPELDWHSAEVKDADDWSLAQEAGSLMPSRGRYWHLLNEWDGTARLYGTRPPGVVASHWLALHEYLLKELEA